MTMGLVVIMIVLIGVMGAGLLTFVNTDLNTVVEVNQGQKALEVADAGVRAAQRQLIQDGDRLNHYDGDVPTSDLAWSYCSGQGVSCTGATPTSPGSPGIRLNLGSDAVTVTILETDASPAVFKVISEGRVGDARRKVEATLRLEGALSMPRAYLTRGNLTLTGGTNVQGVSFFALSNVRTEGSFTPGTQADSYFGRWADTPAVGSYPNGFNSTPRGSNLSGIGALGTVSSTGGSDAFRGSRSYDSTTNPRMVEDPDAVGLPGQQASEITFPFEVPNQDQDKRSIDALRRRALLLEQTNPGVAYYIDSVPGNGLDDAGMPNRPAGSPPLEVDNWYGSSDFETVRFYEFETYNANNRIKYAGGTTIPDCSSTSPPRGLMVLQNGDFALASSRVFEGAVIVRAYDSSGNTLPPPASPTTYTNGSFVGEGSACLRGYANASGTMRIAGSITPGATPDLSSLSAFRGSMDVLSWRELYR